MDIREMIEKCKPFAPVVSAAVVAACVAGSLYGYEAPVYEMKRLWRIHRSRRTKYRW